MSEQELDSMLGEIGGPCNYENMVKCFETKMSGFVNDPDDLVVGAFKSYNEECKFAFVFRNTMSLGAVYIVRTQRGWVGGLADSVNKLM